jgi:2,4-dienoyl-CoA reductase-like NADH-dependent reductase (Old Yellow Enzyme family)
VSILFEPVELRGVTARNRVWLAPMCQYSATAQDGKPTDWHLAHLGARAAGGFGVVIAEATAVTPEGRISPDDTGLWSDDQIEPWRRIADFVRGQGAVAAVQLAHAGRKASTYPPAAAHPGSLPIDEGGWETVGPSAEAFGQLAVPRSLTVDDIAEVPRQFAAAAERAHAAGFDAVEIHAAHGYLLHQFLSPLSNTRIDAYGGSFDGRTRLVTEVVDAIREVWPEDKPVFIRFSATDWVDGGWDVAHVKELSARVAQHGVDVVDVSSGGLSPEQRISVGPGYQVPFAEAVRSSGVTTAAVGLITEPRQAEEIVASGKADVVLLGRAALRDPSWPLRAAHELGVDPSTAPWPVQYRLGAWRR